MYIHQLNYRNCLELLIFMYVFDHSLLPNHNIQGEKSDLVEGILCVK